GPDATVIFEVELLSVKDGSAAAAAAGNESPTASESDAKQAKGSAATPAAGTVQINVAFKLDPRLSGPTYGGEKWVSPAMYTGIDAQDTVDAKAVGMGEMGQSVNISPKWIPSDPEMVNVSPLPGNVVRIKVLHAGESKLNVASAGISRELA